MRAVVRDRFGLPDVLAIREIDKPVAGDAEVLVRVRAASVNPADWHYLTGLPYLGRVAFGLRKPKSARMGTDFAGTVEAAWAECKRVLNPRAVLVMVGAPDTNRLLGPLSHLLVTRLAAVGGGPKFAFFIANINRPDMELLRDLLENGKLKPVIDRRYPLSEVAEAFRYMGSGHAQGKIVVNV